MNTSSGAPSTVKGTEKAIHALESISKEFERVKKKQKLTYSSTSSQISKLITTLNVTKTSITQNPQDSVNILMNCEKELTSSSISSKLSQEYNSYYKLLRRLTQVVDKNYYQNFEKVKFIKNIEKKKVIEEAICEYLLRNGYFEESNTFQNEGNFQLDSAQTKNYEILFKILHELSINHNLGPAIEWAESTKNQNLEFSCRKVEFIQILKNKSNVLEAIDYSQKNLNKFYTTHYKEISELMCSILYLNYSNSDETASTNGVDHPSRVPYENMFDEKMWEDTLEYFKNEYFDFYSIPKESPLYLLVSAGLESLPVLFKMLEITKLQGKNWETQKNLASEIEFSHDKYQFHSIFACPVSKESSTPGNPPMLLVCGHVIAKDSLTKLANNHSRKFKCPYCPTEQKAVNAMQIHF